MKYYFSIFLSAAILVTMAAAQEPRPTVSPTPAVVDSDEVVKISTTLIQVDVTITDKDGRVVTDLKPSDFEILENGIKQDITNFTYIPTAGPIKSNINGKSAASAKDFIPIPSVQLRREQVKRTIAIVVDDLGLSFDSMATVRKTLRKFVDEQMQPNDVVAIVRSSVGIGPLQQFTSDKRQLYASIERLQFNLKSRAGVGTFATAAPSQSETIVAQGIPAGSNPEADKIVKEGFDQAVVRDRENTKLVNQFREDIFTDGTLGAINYVVRGMDEMPGRKSLMLFSDGFSVCTTIRPERCSTIVDSMRRLTDIVNRASVSIYSFDARGVAVTAMGADDTIVGQSIDSGTTFQGSVRDTTLRTLGDRSLDIYQGRDGLNYLARETGGRSFFNTNDLNRSLEKALEDQRGFYLLGYQPVAESFDPNSLKYNKLEIKVNRKDLNVRYRSGFFGIEDSDIKASSLTAEQEIYKALTSPFGVKDIDLRINTLFGMDPQTGTYMRALMHVDVKDLKFSDDENGDKKAVLEVLAVTFGDKNIPTNQSRKSVVLTVKNQDFAKINKEGFVYSFVFPIRDAGGYQFGIAVRDSTSGKLGSATQFFEVPKVKKDRLKMSGVVLANYTIEQWKSSTPAANDSSNPLMDTSQRKFKRGTIVEYGAEIYNARVQGGQPPQLITQLRLFHDGQLVLNGKQIPMKIGPTDNPKQLYTSGALKLGMGMASGDYVLQVVVIDTRAKDNAKLATEWVQFELVDEP